MSQQETNYRFKDAEADPERERKAFNVFVCFVFLFEIFCSEFGTFILMFQSAVIKVLLNVRICL